MNNIDLQKNVFCELTGTWMSSYGAGENSHTLNMARDAWLSVMVGIDKETGLHLASIESASFRPGSSIWFMAIFPTSLDESDKLNMEEAIFINLSVADGSDSWGINFGTGIPAEWGLFSLFKETFPRPEGLPDITIPFSGLVLRQLERCTEAIEKIKEQQGVSQGDYVI